VFGYGVGDEDEAAAEDGAVGQLIFLGLLGKGGEDERTVHRQDRPLPSRRLPLSLIGEAVARA